MSELKLGSLFDGIGGWLIAAVRNGVKPVWRAEIDEFPRTVSEFHFPEVTSYGDVREMHGNEVEPVDIICAGSPCQNLSLAGNRQGLNGSESSLFFESIRIVNEMREATNGQYPRFFVWENVFGAFSSNQGNDFRTVLEQITAHKIPVPRSRKWAQAGLVRGSRCDVAWRGLDAQYFGVPQRRKRIFLVADFAAENRCAGEILFNEKSMSRDSEESGETGQTASQKTERRSFDAGGTTVLKIRQPKIIGRGGAGAQYQDDQAYALATHQDQTLFDGTAYTVCAEHSNGMQSKNPLAGCVYKADTTRTLDANGGNPNCAQGGMLICNEAYSIGNGQVNSLQMAEKAGALNCMDDTEKVLIGDEHSAVFGMETYSDYQDAKIASTLRAEGGPLAGGSENFAVQDTKTYAIGNGQPDGLSLSEKAGSLNCMHDQQAVMIEKEVVGALLSRDYKGVSKWAAEEGKLIVQ